MSTPLSVRYTVRLLQAVACASLLLPCGLAHGQSPWKLVWSDEFDGAVGTAPDASKWKFQTGPGAAIAGNEEAETYCAPNISAPPCKANQPNAYLDGRAASGTRRREIGPDRKGWAQQGGRAGLHVGAHDLGAELPLWTHGGEHSASRCGQGHLACLLGAGRTIFRNELADGRRDRRDGAVESHAGHRHDQSFDDPRRCPMDLSRRAPRTVSSTARGITHFPAYLRAACTSSRSSGDRDRSIFYVDGVPV